MCQEPVSDAAFASWCREGELDSNIPLILLNLLKVMEARNARNGGKAVSRYVIGTRIFGLLLQIDRHLRHQKKRGNRPARYSEIEVYLDELCQVALRDP